MIFKWSMYSRVHQGLLKKSYLSQKSAIFLSVSFGCPFVHWGEKPVPSKTCNLLSENLSLQDKEVFLCHYWDLLTASRINNWPLPALKGTQKTKARRFWILKDYISGFAWVFLIKLFPACCKGREGSVCFLALLSMRWIAVLWNHSTMLHSVYMSHKYTLDSERCAI